MNSALPRANERLLKPGKCRPIRCHRDGAAAVIPINGYSIEESISYALSFGWSGYAWTVLILPSLMRAILREFAHLVQNGERNSFVPFFFFFISHSFHAHILTPET